MSARELDIVIPVYNESVNILPTLAALCREVKTPFRVLMCYDMDEDTTLTAVARLPAHTIEIVPVKNPGRGPHSAVLAGFAASTAPLVLVYMADDDYNAGIVDTMVAKARSGCDVVVASRFMPGGSMENCSSVLKAAIVHTGAFLLYHVARVQIHDPTNGFRLFSRRVVKTIEIESHAGFTYSVELLVKAIRLGWAVDEVPARWFERHDRPSRFRVFSWLPHYLRWLLYALATTYLFKHGASVGRKDHDLRISTRSNLND